jgi:hypothetical protein
MSATRIGGSEGGAGLRSENQSPTIRRTRTGNSEATIRPVYAAAVAEKGVRTTKGNRIDAHTRHHHPVSARSVRRRCFPPTLRQALLTVGRVCRFQRA